MVVLLPALAAELVASDIVELRDFVRMAAPSGGCGVCDESAATLELGVFVVKVVGVACPHRPVVHEHGRLLWFELVGVAEDTEFMAVPEDEHMEMVD